jgi:sugar lactone lactonase YvrE
LTRRLAPVLVALACTGAAPPMASAAPGDVGVADEGAWFGTSGRVLRVGAGGGAALLAAGAPLSDPWAVAVAGDGDLLVTDEGAEAVFSISPSGKLETVVSGAGLQDPVGLALAPDGKAYVSDRQRDEVLRLDLATGALSHVADVDNAMGLAMDGAGKLLVADGDGLRRIDLGTGAITTVAEGAPLADPRDVAVQLDGTLYVAGERQVVRVNPATGAKAVLASGPPLSDPRGIDVEPDGDLLVAEGRYAGGALIHVARATGAKTVRASGSSFRVPSGLGVVGGAGVDASGGGNGDPNGPAAPEPPPGPGGPGTPGGPGPGTPGAPGAGGTVVTLPDGRTITLPPGVTAATSGIRGVDFAAPAFLATPKLSTTRFRAARRGRAFLSVPIGTTIAYALNEPARVTISVQKYRHLSRFCRRKVARRSRHRTGTRCRRWISIRGRYAKASLAGASSVRFRGRLRGRALRPGRYRFVIRARDGAGNVSKPRRPVFRIVR